jgi:hypothetical protein
MEGEAIMGLARHHGPARELPDGISRLPGPCMFSAARFITSPVGPFLAFTVAHPARAGGRVGWCTTDMVVDRQGARAGVRLAWGFPAEVGRLRWLAQGDRREMVWDDCDVVIRARGRGLRLPMVVPHPDLQHRGDVRMAVPDRMWARFQAARVRVHAPEGHDLAWLVGGHVGLLASGVQRVLREAKVPVAPAAVRYGDAPSGV